MISRIGLGIFISVLLFPAMGHAKELLFPLRYQKGLTSSFGEYRIGHSHAGLDFSTGLQNGRLVQAADHGDIIQIKVSYTGYGKALYQRTPDGRVLVYAHLSGFASDIDKIVRSIQQKNGRYSFSRFFGPGEIPVKRGELIAYSGDTGTDVPHLHFEVRNSSNVTINPLLNGITVEDTVPPTIETLYALPRDFDAHVDGGWHEKMFSFQQTPEGAFLLDQPIRIGGNVGLAVKVIDYVNDSPRLLNPYRIEFQIDGKRAFFIRYDQFDYSHGNISELDYVYKLKEQLRGSFHRLYRLYKPIVFYPENLSGDLSELPPGTHTATILAGDAAGNESRATFKLIVNRPPRIDSAVLSENPDGLKIKIQAADSDGDVTRVSVSRKTETEEWEEIPAPALGKGIYEAEHPLPGQPIDFRIVATDDFGERSSEFVTAFSPGTGPESAGEVDAKASFSIRERIVSLLLLRSTGFSYSPELRVTLDPPVKNGTSTLPFVLYQEPTAIRLNAKIPEEWPGGVFRVEGIFKNKQRIPYLGRWEMPIQMVTTGETILGSADNQARMIFPKDAAYEPFPCRITVQKMRIPTWLEKISSAYHFSQKWIPLRKQARVAITLPDEVVRPQEIGLYLNDRGVWWHVGNERRGNQIAARVNHMGTFALMRDISPPDIGDITPDGVVEGLKPTIEIPVSDAGSGLSGNGIELRLDGKKKIVEYHPYHAWIRYEPEEPLAVGTHKVLVTVTDRAGNTSTRAGSFTISK